MAPMWRLHRLQLTAGEPTDPTGLVHLRARTYHPTLGFFLSLDPVEGVPTVPMSLHGYSYAHGNPVTWTDPSGEILPLVLGGLIIAGITGMGYNLFATQGVGLGGRNQFNLGCVDWKQVGLSGLFMAPLGAAIGLAPLYAFGGGAFTLGLGGLSGRYEGVGWEERLGMDLYAGLFSGGIGGGFGKLFGPTLAPIMDFLGDAGSGTLVDTLLYGDSFEDALVFNALTAGAFQVGSGLLGGWGRGFDPELGHGTPRLDSGLGPGISLRKTRTWFADPITRGDFNRVKFRKGTTFPEQKGRKGSKFWMGDPELNFAGEILRKKPNYWVYRTRAGRGLGDFLLVDQSLIKRIARRARRGWFIELKVPSGDTTTTAHAGPQLLDAAMKQGAEIMRVDPYYALSGSPEELWDQLR